MQAAGYVYGFTTPSMPGIVKIGATDRDPADRLAEANASHTWCPPEPYVAAYTAAVGSAFETERAVHALLHARRVCPRREFFRVSDDEARALFEVVARLATVAPVAPAATEAETDLEVLVAPPHHQHHHQYRSEAAQLGAWVDARYAHVPLREKDTGTKLEALYAAYAAASPPVHAKVLGKIMFGKMLNVAFPNVGPHKNGACTASGLYLLR
jgi:hypothetical protein